MRTLLLTILSILLAILLCEGLLRLAGYTPRQLVANPHFAENTWALRDPVLGWTNRAGEFRSLEYGNAMMSFWPQGRRASWREQSRPANSSVYVMGGSFTQGYGVADEATYVYRLNALYPGVMFHNFGVGGYSTYQSLLKLRQALDTAPSDSMPRLIIYGYIGDHERRNVATYHWVKALTDTAGHYLEPPHVTIHGDTLTEHPMKVVHEWPLETRSAFITLLHDAAMQLRLLGRKKQRRDATDRLVMQFKETADRYGAEFLVLLLNNVKDGFVAFLDASGISYLDCVNPDFETEPRYRVGGEGHPSALQHEQWADCLQRYLDSTALLSAR